MCERNTFVKMGVVLRQAWSESQWTVLMGYLTISTNIRWYQTHHRWQFFLPGRHSALVHCACNTVQLLQRSRIIQYLSEKNVIFVFPHFCQVVQEAQVIWGGTVKHVLIAYFIGDISAKNIKIHIKVIASQRWDVFLGTECTHVM